MTGTVTTAGRDEAGLAMPQTAAPFAGDIVDVDTHEMIPVHLWAREFGPATQTVADVIMNTPPDRRTPSTIDLNAKADWADDNPVNGKTVWEIKGVDAPGALDPLRRLDVMDLTGVSRQLTFPSGVGIIGACLLGYPPEYGFLPRLGGDRKAYGKELISASNGWAIRTARLSDRLRPVGIVVGDTVNDLTEAARSLIDQGVRAVWLPNSMLPGGVSPAHPDLDPLWRRLAEARVSATTHIGGESGFLASQAWAAAPAFEGFKFGLEFNLSPWHLSVQHLPSQNFVSTMVLGSVFERHPSLRFGVIEVGAYWVGPMAQALDLWHQNGQKMAPIDAPKLPRLPSEYIKSNVRVSTFPFEPVDEYIDKFGLEDVYCYASDYPHPEGGAYAMHTFGKKLERHGSAIMQKFFVENGAFLVPH
jgi:predicted TIM-barrel fold metal-dependent hydrolase